MKILSCTRFRFRLRPLRGAAFLAAALLGLLVLPGCTTTKRSVTNTERSATEQILVAGAAERAVEALAWPDVAGRAVAVQATALNDDDADYLIAVAESHARQLGARVVPADAAEWRILLQGGALGTTAHSRAFGIPAIPLFFGETPALDFVKILRQRGWARVDLEAIDGTGVRVAAAPTVLEDTSVRITTLFFFAFRRVDLPDEADDGFRPD